MGTASQWLSTEVDQSVGRGTTTERVITVEGLDTTLTTMPVKTRTSTETAVATSTTTTEDEGYTIMFDVIIDGGLGKIPSGDTA
jgi:hypothetical protein